jgi:hypothetical protein
MAPHAFADLSISLISGSLWNEGIRGLWYNDNSKKKAYLIGFWFSQFLMLKNRPEPHKISSVWTGSRFSPGHIDKEYYFPVQLNF